MSIDGVLASFVTELNRIRREEGEETFRRAARNAAKMALTQGGKVEKFMRVALADVVDFDELQREAQAKAAPIPKPEAPEQPRENEIQQGLLWELEAITTLGALNAWYQTNRMQMEQVATSNLRNALLDAIRSKRNALRKAKESPDDAS